MKNHYGLVLYHSMGSGKTITSLAMVYQFTFPIIIISTKASRKNFQDDIKYTKINKYYLEVNEFDITIQYLFILIFFFK